MHVAVAIVAFQNVADVLGCLEALVTSTYADFEVVICENGGPAAYSALMAQTLEHLPGGQKVTRVLAPGNVGFAGGVNRCIEETPDADAWWVLNPDTAPHADALAKLVERLETGDCDAVGGTLQFPTGLIQSQGGHWRMSMARAVSIGRGRELGHALDQALVEARQNYLSGASMLVSRRFLAAAGPMREDYFLYCEEVEWCLRARAMGLRFGHAAGAIVTHHQGTTTGNPADVHGQARLPVYLNERNRLLLTYDVSPALVPLAGVFALALIFLRYARRGAWKQLRFAIQGWMAGLRNLRGKPDWVGA